VYRVLLGKVQAKGDELAFNSIRMMKAAASGRDGHQQVTALLV
jgi:hypothetical protein